MSEAGAVRLGDYSLVGRDTVAAIESGLAEAVWYTSPVSRQDLQKLLERRNGPAIRDTVLWFALIIGSGVCGAWLWGSPWAAIPFAIYGVLYASTSDSRWHESGHGTAFRTDWMNNALYEIASFMVLRESVPWRWSHTRHHSDTIIVGRDPEIAVPRPPNLLLMAAKFFGLKQIPTYIRSVLLHSAGRLTPAEKTYIPSSEYEKVFLRARVYVLIYTGVIGVAVATRSLLPLMFVGLPIVYGGWLLPIYSTTQHAGLAENVLDHRLNCRTVQMNWLNRFLYWNMNYHVEHHMYPLVPYYNLPALHALIKDDCPPAYRGLLDAWREIIPAVLRQVKAPGYFVERKLPPQAQRGEVAAKNPVLTGKGRPVNGWVEACVSAFLKAGEVIRLDYGGETYALYRLEDGSVHASAGICTHGRAHLADGLVHGRLIECPKHNGRFDIVDGSPQRRPVCVPLQIYPAREEDGKIYLKLE